MDHSIIRSLKAHYRGQVVRSLCGALDKDQPYTKISIRQAMKVLIVFWDTVTQKMFMNCFKKAGITSEAQSAAILFYLFSIYLTLAKKLYN